mmetsp:Transcript_36602/g.37270  ORF Transcript_36602/g.37270 Transcript_36602/m.37270 type:complete len:129 (-) Transcript_36602:146-532(-)
MMLFGVFVLCSIIQLGYSFRPVPSRTILQNRHKTASVNFAKLESITSIRKSFSVHYAEDEKAESDAGEPKEEPRKEISDSMKARLRREIISQGGDPNYSAGPILGNPILLISIVIGILVVLGGKGLFY